VRPALWSATLCGPISSPEPHTPDHLLARSRVIASTVLACLAFTAVGCSDAATAPITRSLAPHALADYGPSALYQVEISANTKENGFWIWAELSPGPTGDYQETDCIHLGGGQGNDGAIHASGTLTGWSISNGILTMTGMKIIGGAETATITIPVGPGVVGHYNTATITVTSAVVPIIPVGTQLVLPAQVQVAP
jgi:hypothetical protein